MAWRWQWIAGGLGVLASAVAVVTCVSDNTVPTDAGPNDAPAGDAANACTTRVVDDAKGVYVTLNGNDTSTCGERINPCKTIQAGVNQAKLLSRTTVYVARGTFTESVTMTPGVTIEGGWDTLSTQWVPICDSGQLSALKIQIPPNGTTGVTANSGTSGLSRLTILGKATAAPSESQYGVFLTSSTFRLENVVVSMTGAGVGDPGDAGADGKKGADASCTADSGTAGAKAGDGIAGSAGTFGPSGYTPANGLIGSSDGGTGIPGACALGPSCITTCYTCKSICPNPTSGCGGGPGSGGMGGLGGGSSIAVFAWDSTVTVVGGSFTSGNGGNGGNGGAGGAGGTGGGGKVEQVGCLSNCSDAGCASVGNTTIATAQVGGAGGAGGQGSGGAGGHSYAIYGGGTTKVTLENAPTLAHGAAGTGGVVNGPPGKAADRFP